MPVLTRDTVTSSSYSARASKGSGKLSKRDYWLLPLLSVATILFLFAAAELSARIRYPEKEYEECRVQGAIDPRRAKPNCTVNAKVAEGPWVTYAMNECGYRTPDSCGPKPANTLRIALLGASMTMGKNVPLDQTWGERLARKVTQMSGHAVQVENLGWELLSPLHCYRQIGKVVSLQPDLVIYAVNPFDLNRGIDRRQLAQRNDPVLPPMQEATLPHDGGVNLRNTLKAIQNALADSTAVTMAQHFLFSNPDTFLRIYLADGDRADYVRQPFTEAWKSRFSDFSLILGDMATRLHKAGIPLVLVSLPARCQVVMVMEGHHPPGTDPYAYDRELQRAAARAGVPFVPTLDAFARHANGDKLFYVVDQHITGEGDRVIANVIERDYLKGAFATARN
jgi:hypothetical protein